MGRGTFDQVDSRKLQTWDAQVVCRLPPVSGPIPYANKHFSILAPQTGTLGKSRQMDLPKHISPPRSQTKTSQLGVPIDVVCQVQGELEVKGPESDHNSNNNKSTATPARR